MWMRASVLVLHMLGTFKECHPCFPFSLSTKPLDAQRPAVSVPQHLTMHSRIWDFCGTPQSRDLAGVLTDLSQQTCVVHTGRGQIYRECGMLAVWAVQALRDESCTDFRFLSTNNIQGSNALELEEKVNGACEKLTQYYDAAWEALRERSQDLSALATTLERQWRDEWTWTRRQFPTERLPQWAKDAVVEPANRANSIAIHTYAPMDVNVSVEMGEDEQPHDSSFPKPRVPMSFLDKLPDIPALGSSKRDRAQGMKLLEAMGAKIDAEFGEDEADDDVIF
eukprot:COSAG01_NODE_10519_length_2145_cov_1.506843_1_plen_280_part_00